MELGHWAQSGLNNWFLYCNRYFCGHFLHTGYSLTEDCLCRASCLWHALGWHSPLDSSAAPPKSIESPILVLCTTSCLLLWQAGSKAWGWGTEHIWMHQGGLGLQCIMPAHDKHYHLQVQIILSTSQPLPILFFLLHFHICLNKLWVPRNVEMIPESVC